jgi:lysophospholipase L1-like esterase
MVAKLVRLSAPLFLSIFGALVALIISEIGLRFYEYFYLVPPASSVTADGVSLTYGHKVIQNSFGFREREIFIPKENQVKRVMVLGDSYTWGLGLDIEDTYVRVAEKLLNSSTKQRKLELLNFALPGLNTRQQGEILEKYINHINPDLIVVGFCFNDPSEDKTEINKSDAERFFQSNRYLIKTISIIGALGFEQIEARAIKALRNWQRDKGILPQWMRNTAKAYQVDSPEWQAFLSALKKIKRLSDDHNLPQPLFAILNQGDSLSEAPNFIVPSPLMKTFYEWWNQAGKAAHDAGFCVYDHLEEIKKELPGQFLGINGQDWHPSKELNQLYGKKLALYLQEKFNTRRCLSDK